MIFCTHFGYVALHFDDVKRLSQTMQQCKQLATLLKLVNMIEVTLNQEMDKKDTNLPRLCTHYQNRSLGKWIATHCLSFAAIKHL